MVRSESSLRGILGLGLENVTDPGRLLWIFMEEPRGKCCGIAKNLSETDVGQQEKKGRKKTPRNLDIGATKSRYRQRPPGPWDAERDPKFRLRVRVRAMRAHLHTSFAPSSSICSSHPDFPIALYDSYLQVHTPLERRTRTYVLEQPAHGV